MHYADEDLVNLDTDDGPLQAAVYARVDTSVGFTRMFTPVGNYLIARPAARAKAHEITEQTHVPLDAAMVIGLTPTSMHVWSADPMLSQVHDYLGAVPRSEIVSITAGAGRSWQPITITLRSGDAIEVDARGAVHQLLTAFA